MGVFLDKPKIDKENFNGSGNGLRYGLSAMQGWRTKMEDAHSCELGLPVGLKDWSFFAVYDGHAGAFVSNHCSKHLLNTITQDEAFKNYDLDKHDDETIKRVIKNGFLELDQLLREETVIKSGEESSGTTVSSCLLSPTQFFFANCGDSRALLCRNGSVHFATKDHKPHLDDEKKRIEAAGGSVIMMRVNGSLAVSRALGDFEYKMNRVMPDVQQLVSPEPEVDVFDRDPEADEYMVVACDGIWDELTNEDLCAFVSSRLKITDNLESICSDVIDTCLHKGSRDNMSIIIVTFPAVPKVCPEAQKAEEDLHQRLRAKIDEFFESQITSINEILERLSNFPGLPLGGGVHSKRNFIWDYMVEKKPELAAQSEEDSSAGGGYGSGSPIDIMSQRYHRFAAASSAGLIGGGSGFGSGGFEGGAVDTGVTVSSVTVPSSDTGISNGSLDSSNSPQNQ